MKRIECATSQEAVDLLRYCMSEGGRIIEGFHFREELKAEKVALAEAYFILRSGNIYEPPELDIKTGEWKWKVEGLEPDGKWLVVVFSFKAVDCAFLITIYSVEARRRGVQRK